MAPEIIDPDGPGGADGRPAASALPGEAPGLSDEAASSREAPVLSDEL